MRRMTYTTRAALLLALNSAGCSDDTTERTGELTVLLEAEDTISGGLDPGDEGESIQDGWQVRYEQFIVGIGAIALSYATDDALEASADEVFAVDLVSVPEAGSALWTIPGLRAGRWQFGYTIRGGAGLVQDESVGDDDFARMQAEDLTYLIRGRLTKPDGRSCPPAALADVPGAVTADGENAGGDICYANAELSFTFAASVDTRFGPCAIDGVPGVSVPSGGSGTVAATLHGDHVFFNGFPEGDEGGIVRLAQWLADSDLDLDADVTQAELESIAPANLPALDDRYQLGGSPITPLRDMWTYVRAQLATQGHMDGEGECSLDVAD
jgi:hypothetical protein